MIAHLPDHCFVHLRLQPPQPRKFLVLFDDTQTRGSRMRIEHQYSDVHPFIAQRIGRVPQHPVSQNRLVHRH
jgi:hypothetical protein